MPPKKYIGRITRENVKKKVKTRAYSTIARPPEIMSDHQNIHIQWSCGPPKYLALIRIITCPKDISSPLEGDITRNIVPSLTLLREQNTCDQSSSLSCPLSCLLWFYKPNDVKTHRKREKNLVQHLQVLVVVKTTKTRLHKSRSSRDELEFDLSNFVWGY